MGRCIRTISITCTAILVLVLLASLPNISHGAVAPLVSALPPVKSGISTPVRLAEDSTGNIYVTDPRGGGILKYDSAGNLLQTINTSKNIFGVAIANNGDLLVSQGNTVAVFNRTTGVQISQFGTFVSSNGITVDTLGNVYVTDSLNSCVQVFNPAYLPVNTGAAAAGKPANSFGSAGRATGQFVRPTGISYEKISNQLAIVDTLAGQVQFYSTTGVFQSSIGSSGAGPLKFTAPQSVAFEYSKDGSTLSRIYVADSYQSNVQVIDAATGGFLSYVGSYGLAAGQLINPGDILFDRFDPLNNRLLIASGSGTLAIFSIDMITGNCGASHNGSFVVAPANNLCRTGILTNFSGSGPWSWSCAGQNGGTTATCSAAASVHQATVNVVASNGGSGSVTSSPGGINCLSGTCSASFAAGSSVMLMPRANVDSIFAGWTGDCVSAGKGDCTASMTANRNATATFTLIPKARVSGVPFGSIASAYATINLSGIIEAQAITFVENLNFNRGSAVTLQGGYDSAYSSRNGPTVLNGTLTVGSGSLVVDGLVIQ